MTKEQKTVELWPGKVVAVAHPELVKDFDYICEFNKAQKEQDIATIYQMLFALLDNGEQVFQEVREHIIAEKGVFDYEELAKITKKLNDVFPKASSPAQPRW